MVHSYATLATHTPDSCKIIISPPSSSSWTSCSYGPTTPAPTSPALGSKLPRMSSVEAGTVNTGHFAFPKRGCPTIWEGVLTPKKGMVDDGGGGLRRRLPKRLRIELMAIDDSESGPEPGQCKPAEISHGHVQDVNFQKHTLGPPIDHTNCVRQTKSSFDGF